MRNYSAFLKKEIMESVRTYKLFIMLIVFLVFGIMSPLTAKITPDLINILMPEGMTITLAEPTALDSWTQFFKNISQMGLIVMVIVFSGVLATEISKGTLINMLTKGLSRVAVILSKFTCVVLIWTISLVLALGVTGGYTVYLFPDGGIHHLFFSIFCLWLFGVFLLAVLIFSATLVNNNYGCLLITGAAVVACLLANIIPDAYAYNPVSLASMNMDLLTNTIEPSSILFAVVIAAASSLVLLVSSVLVFRKKLL